MGITAKWSSIGCILLLVLLVSPAQAGELSVEWQMEQMYNRLSVDASLPILEEGRFDMGVFLEGVMMDTDAFETGIWKLGGSYQLTDWLTVFAGLLDTRVGRSPRSTLLLDPRTNSFLQAGYIASGSRWSYTKLYGDLAVETEDYEEEYKRLGVHYFDWQVLPQLAVGVGETVVTSETFRGDFLFDWVPLLPYYAAKYMPGIRSEPNNALIFLDAEYTWQDVAVYGEFMVNEFPMTPGAGNPRLWAMVVGAHGPWWLVEYSRLTNYAYANGNLDAVYSKGDSSIGHPLGDDAQELWLEARGHLTRWNIDWTGGAFFRGLGGEAGEERSVREWDRTDRIDNIFMSGIPEYHYGLHGSAHRNLNNGMKLGLNVEAAYVNQYEHKEDNTGYAYRAGLEISVPLF